VQAPPRSHSHHLILQVLPLDLSLTRLGPDSSSNDPPEIESRPQASDSDSGDPEHSLPVLIGAPDFFRIVPSFTLA
jgi:hypothetical protein